MANAEVAALFDSLKHEKDLSRLIDDNVRESLYVEYKQKHDRRVGTLDDGDRRHFSRALSGFANADGGILLWGIETSRHEEPRKLKPITAVLDFQDRLKTSLINSTEPVVDGVLLDVIPGDADPGAGYVKCLIPASDKAPHRAMLADREYWKRTTEGYYRLEHFDLEDIFGRRPRPSLKIGLDLKPRAGDDPHDELHIFLLNEGRGVAKHCGFILLLDEGDKVADVRGAFLTNASSFNDRPSVSYADNVGVIHPNGILHHVGHVILLRTDRTRPVSGEVSLYCEGVLARSESVEVV